MTGLAIVDHGHDTDLGVAHDLRRVADRIGCRHDERVRGHDVARTHTASGEREPTRNWKIGARRNACHARAPLRPKANAALNARTPTFAFVADAAAPLRPTASHTAAPGASMKA